MPEVVYSEVLRDTEDLENKEEVSAWGILSWVT